jgi:hypothetical protein
MQAYDQSDAAYSGFKFKNLRSAGELIFVKASFEFVESSTGK